MDRVDSHCHLWTLSRGDYGWLDVNNPAFAPIARDFAPHDLAVEHGRAGIGHCVLVQAAPTEAETAFMLGLGAQHSEIGGVVGWVDLESAHVFAALENRILNPAFKGIRPMLQDIEDTDWLLTAPQNGVFENLADLGLRFDALVLPRHLEVLHRFCLANPGLPVVIDHAAKPSLGAPADDPRHAMWEAGMARLARETQCLCKVSGLLTEMAPAQLGEAEAVLQPVVDKLVDWFGPDRLMWGSDWPVVRLAGDYDIWDALSLKLLGHLDDAAKAAVFGGTADRFYDLGIQT